MQNHNVYIPNLLPLYTRFAGHHMKFCVYPAIVSIVTKRVFRYRQICHTPYCDNMFGSNLVTSGP